MLGTFRLWRIIAADTLPILVRARHWLLKPLIWDVNDEPDVYERGVLAEWLECPYCSGAWFSVATYLLWLWLPTETLYVAAPLAISAAVGIIRMKLD